MFKAIFFVVATCVQVVLFAAAPNAETMEREMWQYIKSRKWNELESRIAPFYQAALFDGARSKEQYMGRARSLNINDFTLSNFSVTEGNGLFVVTYDAETSETFEGQRISSKAARLSVWQQNNGIWQWIAHAVLIPVPERQE